MALREINWSDWTALQIWQTGHHGPSTVAVVKHGRKKIGLLLSAGTRDDVTLYKEDGRYYALTTNSGMGYAGLQEFTPGGWPRSTSDSEPMNEARYSEYQDEITVPIYEAVAEKFVQFDWQIAETLGPRGLDLSDRTIAKRLMEYL